MLITNEPVHYERLLNALTHTIPDEPLFILKGKILFHII